MGNTMYEIFNKLNNKTREDTKQILLDKLAEEPEQVVALAYAYAKNMVDYGADVTKAWCSAVQQGAALHEADMKGRCDSDKEWREHCKQLGNKASQLFVDEFIGE